MKKVLIGLALVAASVSAFAQSSSRFVVNGSDGPMYHEGLANHEVKHNGIVAIGWFKIVNPNGVEHSKHLIQVHCKSNSIRSVRSLSYISSTIISDTGEQWYNAWQNPIPGTYQEYFTVICNRQ